MYLSLVLSFISLSFSVIRCVRRKKNNGTKLLIVEKQIIRRVVCVFFFANALLSLNYIINAKKTYWRLNL